MSAGSLGFVGCKKWSSVGTSFVPGYASAVAYRRDGTPEKDLVRMADAARRGEVLGSATGRKQRRLTPRRVIEVAIVYAGTV